MGTEITCYGDYDSLSPVKSESLYSLAKEGTQESVVKKNVV